jgi:hypothetical protein
MTDSQQKVLDWLRLQRGKSCWFRPSDIAVPGYAGGPSSIGIVLRALVELRKVEVRMADRGNGTQCREYRAIAGPDPHRKKEQRA